MKYLPIKTLLLVVLTSSLFLLSCTKDESGTLSTVNGIIDYDDQKYGIVDGWVSHKQLDTLLVSLFVLADAPIPKDSSVYRGDIQIIFSTITSSNTFQSGAYDIGIDSKTSNVGSLFIKQSKHNSAEPRDIILAQDGYFDIQKSDNSYTLSFHIEFENDISLTGKVSGELLSEKIE